MFNLIISNKNFLIIKIIYLRLNLNSNNINQY
jgi:hypothetical protein